MRLVLMLISAAAVFALAATHAAGEEPVKIIVGDAVSVTISDLMAPNVDTTKTVTVDKNGSIELPLIGKLKVADQTEDEAEATISDAYAKAKILAGAQVSVKIEQPTTKPAK